MTMATLSVNIDTTHNVKRWTKKSKIDKVIPELSTKEKMLLKTGWCLDTHSSFLSRKNSRHCMIGKKRYTKIIKRNKKWN